MIRINLITVERQRSRKAFAFDAAQKVTLACSLVLVTAALGIGWWYWTLTETSAQVDIEIATAQQEAARLRSLLAEVQRFEERRAQLQERVNLIEQLRKGQSAPVQLLDHVSRSLPDMLWLTGFEQSGGAVTLEGRSTTLIALSDFVGNLGSSDLIKKPIDIVDSQVEPATAASSPGGQPGVELIKFTVKAQLVDAKAAPSAAPGAARPVVTAASAQPGR